METTNDLKMSLHNIKRRETWAYIFSLYPWLLILFSYIIISLPGCRWMIPIFALFLYFGFFVVSGINFVISAICLFSYNFNFSQSVLCFFGINSISIFWLHFIFH